MVESNVLFVGKYNGHSVKQSGAVNLSLRADYSELTDYVQLIQMLNNDIKIAVKMPDESKGMKLGMFRLKSLNIMADGEGKINFVSTTDFVEVDNLNKLVCDEYFKVMCRTSIEEE